MATISRSKTWVDTDILTADDLNGEFDTVYNEVNGSLSNANVSATAAVAGSKLDLSSVTTMTTSGNVTVGGTLAVTGTQSFTGATTVSSLIVGTGTYDKTRYINLTPAGAVFPSSNYPALAQTDGTNLSYWTLAFDKDTDESCFWLFDVPAEYDGGTCVFTVKAVSTATSGGVVWTIKTASVADAATLDSTLGSEVIFDAKTVDGSAGDIFEQSKTFDPGWTAGNLAVLQLLRNVGETGDTAAADVKMVILVIEWEVA